LRYMRASVFDLRGDDTTMVVGEDDLVDDIHVISDHLRQDALMRGLDCEVEIFEFEGDITAAAIEGRKRAKLRIARIEHLKATLADHIISKLKLTTEDGSIITPSRAPLTKDEIVDAMDVVRKHKWYRRQTVHAIDNNGETVIWKGA
jgi:hypothetical protein